MEKYNFKVGDRVGEYLVSGDEYSYELVRGDWFSEYSDKPSYGTILDLPVKGGIESALVKWDSTYDYTSTVPLEALMPEEEMKKKVSSLEDDFKILQGEVNSKMEEVAKLLKEANNLASEKGFNLKDISGVEHTLFSAMDNGGWNTSSFGC